MNPIVTISGGGIIGNYISSRLNKNNIESLVIEKSPADLREKENIRTLTLNSYSKELLDDLGIDIDYAEIKKINVFDGEGAGKIDFSSDEINSDNLSYVVYFNDLQKALKIREQERTLFEEEIKKFKEDGVNKSCEILLSKDKQITSQFIAGCDGRNSNIAKLASLKPISSDYNQTAITFTAKSSIKDLTIAHQVFSEKGIFAIMPLPSNTSESTHTVVWSVDNSKLQDQNISEYVKKYISYFEKKLKIEIILNSNIISFNLSNHYFEEYISGSLVLIGDAAHSIHPIAGQGWNLGLRDIKSLTKILKKSKDVENQIGTLEFCKTYNDLCYYDAYRLFEITDKLDWIFKKDQPHLKFIKKLGFNIINKNKTIKNQIVNFAMGI